MSHEKYSNLIKLLHECVETCNHCYTSCLHEENVGEMSKCIRLDRECADICAFVEQSLTRDTPYVKELAQLCVKACRDCGDECAKHEHDHCQQCAEACYKCADECENLIA